MGWAARPGQPPPPLSDYYRGGLRYDTEPGTRWAYSNHGYATLGQIVADVSGLPFDHYMREHVFAPLGMKDSDAVACDRLRPRLATGYTLKAGGFVALPHHEVITAGGSSVYSTTSDMARYTAALLNGGAGPQGGVLRPETLEMMFAAHYQSDPRLPGMGLGFFREELGGHRIVAHDGILNGFRTDMRLALDEGIGVVVMANSGGFDPRGVSGPVSLAVIRLLLGLPDDVLPAGVPERPWVWSDLCGWYSFGRGMLTDPQPRMAFGGGVEVVVRGGHLWARGQMPPSRSGRSLRLPCGPLRAGAGDIAGGVQPQARREGGGPASRSCPHVVQQAARPAQPEASGRRLAGSRSRGDCSEASTVRSGHYARSNAPPDSDDIPVPWPGQGDLIGLPG